VPVQQLAKGIKGRWLKPICPPVFFKLSKGRFSFISPVFIPNLFFPFEGSLKGTTEKRPYIFLTMFFSAARRWQYAQTPVVSTRLQVFLR
jgi:hypothetical protein